MRPEAAARRGTLSGALPGALAIALAAAAALTYAQAPAAGMYGYDGPYHIRYSELLREDLVAGRGFSRQFPWWQETFLKDRWADKDFLYHLLLIPFTFGDLDAGGKAASLVFGTAFYVSLFLALRWAGAPAPAIWTLAALLGSTTLMYRAGLVRSHVVAIPLAVLGTAAILRRSRAGIFLASAAYAYAHVAWHLLPCVALVHDAARALMTRRIRPSAFVVSLAGAAAAVAINPYFPNNLRLWRVQNIDVLAMAWSPSAPDLSLGSEFRPGDPSRILYDNLGPALFTLAGVLLLAAPGRTASGTRRPESLALFSVAIGFLAMSLLSRRFTEFWAPFSVMFAAVMSSRVAGAWSSSSPRARWAAGAALPILLVGLGAHNLAQTRRIIADDPGRIFDACATWIRDNVPPGQTIFTTDWDEFPDLFFVAPRQRYLVGLDPTFMYVTNPDRWRLWKEISEARVADIVTPIGNTFGCRYLFADAGKESFIERADQDPMLRCEARDADCGVYTLRDEPPSTLAVPTWRLDGGGTLRAGPRDFVDVGSMRPGGAPADGEACGVLRGGLESPRPGPVTLAISTDDSVTVEVNGRMTLDGAEAAVTLEEALEQQRSGTRRPYDRRGVAELDAGYNEVVVSTCRAGRAWGFFLRVILQP